mmetsp:Transcript_11167/g.32997  ORF Transcript_11167/g.32997 Transcript_11167/m.32997 type:complete len:781 (+) Transcript_11167:131-2473(+)
MEHRTGREFAPRLTSSILGDSGMDPAPSGATSRAQSVGSAGTPKSPWAALSPVRRKDSRYPSLNQLHVMDSVRDQQELKSSRWTAGDFFLGTKTGHLLVLLAMAILLLFGGALAWRLMGGNDLYDDSWSQSFWFSWGMFFDPGTQMSFEAREANKFKTVAMLFSVCGFTFNLLLLGIIVETARMTLDSWKKSRSRIVATGHTLLLGWSEKTLFLLRELGGAAKSSREGARIVILAQEDELLMETQVAQYFHDPRDRRRIQFRTGCPHHCAELMKVSAPSARTIIILGGGVDDRRSDLGLVRTTVALASLPTRPGGSIVAEVRHSETSHVIRSVLDSARGVIARDAINRVLCLVAVDPAVGHCYADLVSFVDGQELYCVALSKLDRPQEGTSFGEACAAFGPEAICVGAISDGQTVIAPPEGYRLDGKIDKLLILANSQAGITNQSSLRKNAARKGPMAQPARLAPEADVRSLLSKMPARQPKTIVVVGWPVDVGDFAHTLDFYLARGSTVHVLSEVDVETRQRRLQDERPGVAFSNIRFEHVVGAPTSIRQLRNLPLEDAAAILVLAEGPDDAVEPDATAIDSASLASVITIDSLLKKLPRQRPALICEILDPETERMLSGNSELHKCATFFHSNALETGMFAMASSTPDVFNALLRMMQPEETGSIAAMPAEVYLGEDELDQVAVDFWDLRARVRQRGDLLLGWKFAGADRPDLNPPKDIPIVLRSGDTVLVLTGDAAPTGSHFGSAGSPGGPAAGPSPPAGLEQPTVDWGLPHISVAC